jgi:hypothetical protein
MIPIDRIGIASDTNLVHTSHLVASSIAEMSLRECAFLDGLWIRRNAVHLVAVMKRRHKPMLRSSLPFIAARPSNSSSAMSSK